MLSEVFQWESKVCRALNVSPKTYPVTQRSHVSKSTYRKVMAGM